MPYQARFSRVFLKKVKKLPSETKVRVVQTIKQILIKPDNGIVLVGPLKGLWKARVGKYRILYEISQGENAVVFHDVDLRKEIYE
jgi:mRNA interferase RelE/StbE